MTLSAKTLTSLKLSKQQWLDIFLSQHKCNQVMSSPDYLDVAMKDGSEDYMFAAIRELVEAADWLGWEWWKATTRNLAEAKLEIIDTIHFLVSSVLVHSYATAGTTGQTFEQTLEKFAELIVQNAAQEEDLVGFVESWKDQPDNKAIMALIKFTIGLANDDVSGPAINSCLVTGAALGLTADELFSTYISKNTLNIFRTNHGYKQGTYVKMWAKDTEDNAVMRTLSSALQAAGNFSADTLYAFLEEEYAKVTK